MEGSVDGNTGRFPKTFIRVIRALPEHLVHRDEPEDRESETTPSARAMFMFTGEKSGELSFDKGEYISISL